ncbi:MAG: phosphoribosylamine--glycine ligase [Nitrospinota bacterium]
MLSSKINILLIGEGGREAALAWKIAQSPMLGKLFIAKGNGGTSKYGTNIEIDSSDIDSLIEFAKERSIDLTVVGPEAPLVAGIVDRFNDESLKIFGPSKLAAQLEGSKVFMKTILEKRSIPTAKYKVAERVEEGISFLELFDNKVVIKADGLCQGKGVIVPNNKEEAILAIKSMLTDKKFGAASNRIIIEEALQGEEVSILAFCDGADILMMPSAQDHKRIFDNDQGPNTGGMGAYSPAPIVTKNMEAAIEKNIITKTVEALLDAGISYKGILYVGLMITDDGIKVLEYNCRFGDPECQAIMVRLESDIIPILLATVDGQLKSSKIQWSDDSSVTVVVSSAGYPGGYETGKLISGIENYNNRPNINLFVAGANEDKTGNLVTTGGRVLSLTAVGPTIKDAIATVYKEIDSLRFDGAFYRKDIGWRALNQKKL